MALHHSLRDLVSVRGPGVVDEAEEFRGVLDDFLAEDEASLGELNLLVDAVRLGALRRVLDVLAHGAAPEAADPRSGRGAGPRPRHRRPDPFLLGAGRARASRSARWTSRWCGCSGPTPAPCRPRHRRPPRTARRPASGGPGYHTAERPETQVLSNEAPGSQPVAAAAGRTASRRPRSIAQPFGVAAVLRTGAAR